MAKFRTVIIFPDTRSEARYEFDAVDSFLQAPPVRVVEAFLSSVQGLKLPGAALDTEINAANRYTDAITASGRILLKGGGEVAFMAMISRVAF